MFSDRWKLGAVLIVVATVSYQTLELFTEDGKIETLNKLAHYPDYTMENFTTLTMDQNGTPKNRLNAVYIAHYPDDDTSELNEPEFEIFRKDQPSIIVSANKGWVTSNNQVILLENNVYLYQYDQSGELKIELIAEDARILVDQKYAETDKTTTLITKRTVTNATGMRAYLKEQRMEFLNNVHTTIEPKP